MQALTSRYLVKSNFLRTLTTNNVEKQASSQMKSWKKIPGPSSLPILGQLHHYLPGGSLHNMTGYEFWNKMYKTYGPIVKLNALLMPDVVVLMDSKSMTQVFHGENRMPRRPGLLSRKYYRQYYNKTKKHSLKPAGLSIDQGETWKQLRSKLNPMFLQTNVLKLYSETVDDVAQDMIARFKTLRNDDGLMLANFDYEVSLWALESIGVFVLGGRIHCLDVNLSENSNAYKLIETSAKTLTALEELDMKPSLWKYYPTKKFSNAMKTYENLETPHEFIPERWIVEQGHPLHYGNAKPFAYAPFGFGFRSCIGRRIFELETEIFLKRIIQNFHLGWTGPPPTVVPALVHQIKGPFGFIFKDA